MNNMSYQDAARTRKKSFISMITEKLIEGNSIGSSIKATVSEKSAARSKKFKEKIDPLNIIKFMTGGSKFAAALYGSARGRSEEDMKYFAGNPRSAKNVGASSTRIDSLETGNEMVSLLMKIYEFMRNTNEEDKTRKKRESNFKEEIEYERGLRHKALLEALSGLKPGKTVTATKESDDGGFGGIFAGLIAFVKELIDAAISRVMGIINNIMGTVSVLLSALGGLSQLNLLSKLMTVIVSPVAIAALTGLVAGFAGEAVIDKLAEIREKDKAARPKDYENVPFDVAKITGETPGQVGQRQKRQATKQVTPKYARELLDAKPAFTDAELVEETGLTRTELETELKNNPKLNISPPPVTPLVKSSASDKSQSREEPDGVSQGSSVPVKTKDDSSATPVVSVSPSNPSTTPTSPVTDTATPTATSTDTATPMSATPASATVNNVISENLDMNLPVNKNIKSNDLVNNTITNTTINSQNKVQQNQEATMPSVRNMEETFKRMTLYSTHVV